MYFLSSFKSCFLNVWTKHTIFPLKCKIFNIKLRISVFYLKFFQRSLLQCLKSSVECLLNEYANSGKLRDDKEFTDVTLAHEDGQQVEAHKVILYASSPFLEKGNILIHWSTSEFLKKKRLNHHQCILILTNLFPTNFDKYKKWSQSTKREVNLNNKNGIEGYRVHWRCCGQSPTPLRLCTFL